MGVDDAMGVPIDPRLLGIRELVTMMLGRIEERVDGLGRSAAVRDAKLDSLLSSAERVSGDLRVYVAEDKAAHEALAAEVRAMNLLLIGDRNSDGILKRITDVEQAQAKQRNLVIGFAAAVSVAATGIGNIAQSLGHRAGWW